ncbi:uncharacterized protein LOC125260212 isoform X1 [Megalobrama amblycephala]|uniref:uncharacterized protein LOC125260212 isoform X1 n=1 Tax=Megalobrama amblycephala TaxID=75352 RepID=UPI002013CF92|nr:uncharacterized protein LOC125260212 isoform X1 [Megalobrama amblycephala]
MWVFIVFFTSVEVCGQADVITTVRVKEGGVLNLHPGVDLKGDFQILWSYEGGNQSNRVAQIYQGRIYTHYDERFAGRVQIDQTTGVLTISNIRSNETGLFEAFIVINRLISTRQFNIDVYAPVSSVTVQQSTLIYSANGSEQGAPQTSNTSSTNQTRELYPPIQDCAERCGVTEALIRLVLSGLVGIATVFFLVESLMICSSQRIDSSV